METHGPRPARSHKKGPQPLREAGGLEKKTGGALLSHAPGRSTIAAGALNVRVLGVVPSPRGPLTSVFGKGTGVTAPPRPPARKSTTEDERCERKASQRGFRGGAPEGASRFQVIHVLPPALPLSRIGGGRSGQAARPIRTGLLRPSRALRTRPVHPVVFRGPSACSRTGRTDLRGGLALRCLQRLSRCGVATRRCP